MPLPKKQLAWLRAQAKAHDTTIADLRELRTQLAREIKVRQAGKWRDPNPKPEGIPGMVAWLEYIDGQIASHEGQAQLVRDKRWPDALADLLEDPKRAQLAALDPRGYAEKLGLTLPPEVVLDLRVVAGRPELAVTGLSAQAPFELHWTQDGFTNDAGVD